MVTKPLNRAVKSSLLELNEQLRLVQASAGVGWWDWDIAGGELVWSEQCKRLFGIPADRVMSHEVFLEAVHPDDRRRVDEAVQSALSNSQPYDAEMRVLLADGTSRWIVSKGQSYFDSHGRPVRMAGMAFDISRQKQAEAEAHARAAELETVLDAVPAAVFISRDPKAKFIQSNRFGARTLRMAPEDNVSLTAPDRNLRPAPFRVKQEGVEIPLDRLPVQLAASTGCESRQVELELVFDDGEIRRILGNAAPLMNDDGHSCGAVGAYIDITELRVAEQALRESENLYRSLFSLAPLGVVLTDESGVLHAFNDQVYENLGYTRDELMKLRVWDIDADEGPEEFRQHASQILQAGEAAEFEVRQRTKGGELRHVRVYARVVPLAGAARILCIWQDETERKTAEQALQRSEERLRQTLAYAAAGAWEWDIVTGRIFWSPETFELYGVDPTPDGIVSYEVWRNSLHPDDAARAEVETQDALEASSAEYKVEFRVVHPRRGTRWILGIAKFERDAKGAARRLIGLNLDITDRKAAELALQRSEERLRQTLTYAAAGAWEWDLTGVCVVWSPETFELYGVDPAPDGIVSYEVWRNCLHPDDLAAAEAVTRDAIEGRTSELKTEFRVMHPKRGTRWILSIAKVERDAKGVPRRLMGLNLDITDRKNAEEELRKADQKKNDFLAILSHELRNPLAPIRNSTLLLERAPPGSEPARRALEVLDRQTSHLARLVDDLLDVARIAYGKIELRIAPLDVRETVRRAWQDARALFEEREISLLLHEAAEPIWVDADAARIGQMIGNLLNNALKFTPAGGKVDVTAQRRGAWCELIVSDSGKGIEPHNLQRIFDPFVQSSPASSVYGGLGIGLALVKELAVRHGGSARAESEGLGRGTQFVIQLPLRPAPAIPVESPLDKISSASLAILIIEDNVDAAATLADLLRLAGHRVAVAETGRAGLDAIAASVPDVLICDIGLPDITGYEVIRSLRTAAGPRRALYAIALTGYAQPQDQAAVLAAGFDAHLPKPPDFDALQERLSESVRRRPRDGR